MLKKPVPQQPDAFNDRLIGGSHLAESYKRCRSVKPICATNNIDDLENDHLLFGQTTTAAQNRSQPGPHVMPRVSGSLERDEGACKPVWVQLGCEQAIEQGIG